MSKPHLLKCLFSCSLFRVLAALIPCVLFPLHLSWNIYCFFTIIVILLTFPCHFLPNYCYIYSFFHYFFLTGIFSSSFFLLWHCSFSLALSSSFPPHLFLSSFFYCLCAMYQMHMCAPVAYSILSTRSSESN